MSSPISSTQNGSRAHIAPVIVGLGEALFDCFPTATRLGGAPVNLSLHADALLKQIGGRAIPATRVGADELGRRFLRELDSRKIPTSAVQIDSELPTGRVVVEIDGQGHAAYDFEENTAWDRLVCNSKWELVASNASAVAYGTLAQRSSVSEEAIHSFLLAAKNAVRFFDVNLRQHYYSASIIERSLHAANAVKMNAEELTVVCELLDIGSRRQPDPDDQAMALCLTFGLDWLALTRGSDGTVLYCGGERYEQRQENMALLGATADADSVGAGDACSAGLLVGSLLGWPPYRTLELANRLGAYVAMQPGATPPLPEELLSLVATEPANS